MHLVMEGTVKRLINLWTESKNISNNFYAGKPAELKLLENKFKKIKLPSELPRTSLSLLNVKMWKASDFRNFIYYTSISLLDNVLGVEYFDHLIIYLTAIRLLTQDNLSTEDILHAEQLLVYFIK
jgi:hypothetical protein